MDFFEFETGDSTAGIPIRIKNICIPDFHPPGVVILRVILNVGARHDPMGKEGIAHIMEHLIFEGTEDFPDPGIIESLLRYSMQESFNSDTSHDHTFSMGKTQKSRLYITMQVLRSMFFFPLLRNQDFVRERDVIIQEYWEGYVNRHKAALQKRVQKDIYFRHRFARLLNVIGTANSLNRIKLEDLMEFHDKYYHIKNASFVFVGDISMEEAIKFVDVFSDGAPDGEPTITPEPITSWPVPEIREIQISSEEDLGIKGAEQCEITVRRVIPLQRIQIIWVLQKLLTRIFEKIRAEICASYGVEVKFDNYCDHHLMTITARINPNCLDRVKEDIAVVFKNLTNNGIYEPKFDEVMAIMKVNIALMEVSLHQIAKFAEEDLDRGNRIITLTESREIIEAMTYSDICQLVNRELSPEQLYWLIIKP